MMMCSCVQCNHAHLRGSGQFNHFFCLSGSCARKQHQLHARYAFEDHQPAGDHHTVHKGPKLTHQHLAAQVLTDLSPECT